MDTLYSKIGEQRLNELVDHFYELVFQSPVIQHLFQTDKEEIKRKQVLFLTQFLGGPQLYTNEFGHPKMRMRHMPHVIDHAAKEEWLRCMRQAIVQLEMDESLKSALYNCFPQLAQHMVNA